MTAPASWLREAFERRDALAAQGVDIVLSVSSWGVTVWAHGLVDTIGRSWPAIEGASTNPLVPTIETLADRARRKAA
jgi:hypothetical protein